MGVSGDRGGGGEGVGKLVGDSHTSLKGIDLDLLLALDLPSISGCLFKLVFVMSWPNFRRVLLLGAQVGAATLVEKVVEDCIACTDAK
jgi:hypothetical protein